jgi:hypothetical protein
MQAFTDWLDRCFSANPLWFSDEWGMPADLIHEALFTPTEGSEQGPAAAAKPASAALQDAGRIAG